MARDIKSPVEVRLSRSALREILNEAMTNFGPFNDLQADSVSHGDSDDGFLCIHLVPMQKEGKS